jgi:hypothetical protein
MKAARGPGQIGVIQIGLRTNMAAYQFESGIDLCVREDKKAMSIAVATSAIDSWKRGER